MQADAVDDGDQCPLTWRADDGVDLKVAGSFEPVDAGGTLANGAPVA